MIGYPVTEAELEEKIKKISKTWFTRAKKILDHLPASPASSDFRNLWSEIKEVYINLQHSKCAFCEKALEGPIENDVEHFRPKAEVVPWTPASNDPLLNGLPLHQPAAGNSERGYWYLAYHPLNYAAACKNCNTVCKGNYFPVAKTRTASAKAPPADDVEEPYLIYPIGKIDEDPESLIAFNGLSPLAIPNSGRPRLRALVTIDLFGLGDPNRRRPLLQDRARVIERLYFALELVSSPDMATTATSVINSSLAASSPHANCLRSFHRLYQQSPTEARTIVADMGKMLDSYSPA
jgi:hypothetical protein